MTRFILKRNGIKLRFHITLVCREKKSAENVSKICRFFFWQSAQTGKLDYYWNGPGADRDKIQPCRNVWCYRPILYTHFFLLKNKQTNYFSSTGSHTQTSLPSYRAKYPIGQSTPHTWTGIYIILLCGKYIPRLKIYAISFRGISIK